VTTDALLNVALAVILPLLMAVGGGILAARALPPEDKKREMWIWILGFLFFFVLSIPLAFWQQVRSTNQQGAVEKAAASERLEARGEIKYLQGQIDTTNKILGTLVSNSDPKQIALIWKSLIQAALGQSSREPKLSLGQEGLHLANEMQQWWKQKQTEEESDRRILSQVPQSNVMNVFRSQLASEWKENFSARADAYLSKVKREQADIAVAESLEFECRVGGNMMPIEECWQGIKSIALQIK